MTMHRDPGACVIHGGGGTHGVARHALPPELRAHAACAHANAQCACPYVGHNARGMTDLFQRGGPALWGFGDQPLHATPQICFVWGGDSPKGI